VTACVFGVDNEITKKVIDKDMLRAMEHLYTLTDSILAGDKVEVSFVSLGYHAPAWSDGVKISLNLQQIDPTDFSDIVKVHGLNFHELAHVLYTPRIGTVLGKWVNDNGLNHAFNALEDQRIESFLAASYPSTAPWLTATILRWIVSDRETLGTAYALVRGRRYLPGKVRGALRVSFERQDLLPRLDACIDAYRRLVFPADYEAAKALIREYNDLMGEVFPLLGRPKNDPNGHVRGRPTDVSKGRPKGVNEQRDKAGKLTDEGSSKKDEDTEEGDETSASGVEDKDADEEGKGGAKVPSLSGEGEEDGEEDGESSPQAGSAPLDVHQVIRESLSEVLSSDEVIKEIRRTQKHVRAAGATITLPKSESVDGTPAAEYVTLQRLLRQRLEKIIFASEPGWHRQEDSGRVNAVRWIVDKDPSTAFDRWDEGVHDIADIEAVVLLDNSGSMRRIIGHANSAMWALKRAFDSVGMTTTVIAFDTRSEILYGPDEKATTSMRETFMGGGTNPSDGLEQALRIFDRSTRKQKVCILLTDGDFMGDWRSDDLIAGMNNRGVVTVIGHMIDEKFFSIDGAEAAREYVSQRIHNCSIAQQVDHRSLVGFAGSIVANMMKRRVRR
jgi:hypothetical protein